MIPELKDAKERMNYLEKIKKYNNGLEIAFDLCFFGHED